MKIINGSLACLLLLTSTNALSLKSLSSVGYKADDGDDLLEGLISGCHKTKQE